MNPNAGYHALLMFLGVFGAAAIWFSGFILSIKLTGQPPTGNSSWEHAKYRAMGRVWGLVIAIPTIVYVVIIALFW